MKMQVVQLLTLLFPAALGGTFDANLKPDGIARTLVEVEQRWLGFAAATVDCSIDSAANCTSNKTEATAAFTKSCVTVSNAVVQSSGGDKSKLRSFMADVCSQDPLKGQPAELCLDFAEFLFHEMSEDQDENTASQGGLQLSRICLDLFQHGYLSQYASQIAEHRRAAEANRAEAEQQKLDAAEAAKRQLEADAAAAVARKRLDEAAEITATATRKKEEATRAAVEAQRMAEVAEQAETAQHRLEGEARVAAHQVAATPATRPLEVQGAGGNKTASLLVKGAKMTRSTTRKSFLMAFPITFS